MFVRTLTLVISDDSTQVQGVTSQYEVQIKFPDRDATEEAPNMNGTNNGDGDAVRNCDIIRITGSKEKCEAARQALLDLIPVTVEINVPFDLHRSIIGQKGRDVRELMGRFDVHLELSPPEERLDIIKITGTPANIEGAKKAIEERVAELEVDRKDRELRSFELKIEVDPEFHPKIIGRRGAVINKIRNDHGVQISFPRREDEVDNVITIQGYEEATHAAKEDILKIVNELSEMVKEVIDLDNRIHSRIIGQRGRNIRKIMDDFKVEIKFPRDNERDENPNAVTIIGSEEAVSDVKDHLLNLEEEYLQDVIDMPAPREITNDFSAVLETAMNHKTKKEGFVVQGAPWEKKNKKAPNTASHEDFPDFGLGAAPRDTPISSAWGQRR